MKYLSTILLLLAPLQAFGQLVSLPLEVRGEVGEFIQIPATTKDANVSWRSIDPGLNLFPISLLKDTKTAVVTATRAGKYRVLAVTAKGDVVSEFAMATVIVGTPPIPPGPDPPFPPDPPIPPTPGDSPFGGAVGLHVLIVYETSANLPMGQYSAIYGKQFREYIEANCAKGPDGKTPQRRIYDKDVSMTGESALWQGAMKRTVGKTLPWLIVGNGARWYEGPLPATVEETMAFVRKVGK